MFSERIANLISCLPAVFAVIALLIICGIISDYIVPHCPLLNRLIERYAGSIDDGDGEE